jgi:hypothetical protein
MHPIPRLGHNQLLLLLLLTLLILPQVQCCAAELDQPHGCAASSW